ncbi:MAG: GGDEF domain-containing protein [Motiliproteus sp.]
MRIQSKLTTSLLITGLLSATVVAAVAYWMVMRDFRQTIMEKAYQSFSLDAQAFLNSHQTDDWYQAEAVQSFHQFVLSHRRPPAGFGRHLPRPPKGSGYRPPIPPPGERIDHLGQPPFVFLILSPSGKVIKGVAAYPKGSQVPASVISRARAIEVNGKVAVLASPLGDPILTESDRSYLRAMQHGLAIGIGVAVLLALLIGLIAGRRMSGSLRAMTFAVCGIEANSSIKMDLPTGSKDELGELARAFNQMSHDLSLAHHELYQLSIQDPLTELSNRRHFDEQASMLYEQACRYQQPLTVMIGDLDLFKRINDDFSHQIGDEVLRCVALLLKQGTRSADLVARYGGEEFVLLFPNTSLQQAGECCENLRLKIESYPWHEIAPQLKVTMSMGLSDDLSRGGFEKMIGDADEHLYLAKEQGRNQVRSILAA